MKFVFKCIGAALLLTSCGSSYQNKTETKTGNDTIIVDPAKYAETITQDELKDMLFIYASDEFEGRDTGKEGQKKAVEYLKNQYLGLGIESPISKDDYFQEVPLERQSFSEATTSINGENFQDLVVLEVSEDLDLSVDEITFVGYGIEDDNYSDYTDLDVKGKVLLAKAGEPKDAEDNYIISGNKEGSKWNSGYQALIWKKDAAKAKGAKALLFLDEGLYKRYLPYYKAQLKSGASDRLTLKNTDNGMAMLLINQGIAKGLYKSVIEESSPTTIATKLDLVIPNKSETVNSENVIAVIKGSEKPDEFIVISAHLDHVGVKNEEVYNGADDDGSGTVALLEIAEAFKKAAEDGNGPKRSIVFLHVTGEEKGLLGSQYYTDKDPIFPLENTVANLNIDMIGRTDPKRESANRNYLYLIGSDKLSTELHNISEEVNAKYCKIEFDYKYNDDNDPNRFYYRSDHYNFAKNNIPVIFYFNGTHEDYHQPGDTPDKIQYDLLENRTRLIFHTAWELANRDERIVVNKAFE